MKSNERWTLLVVAAAVMFVNASCSSNTNAFQRFYYPRREFPALAKENRVSVVYADSLKKSQPIANELNKNGFKGVGHSSFEGPLHSVTDAVKHARRIGADKILIRTEFLRKESGSQMVLVESIPGRTINSYGYGSSSAQAQAYGSGYASGSGYMHSNAQVSAYGTGSQTYSESTYIPAVERYERQNYVRDVFLTEAIFFRSPELLAVESKKR